jgi:hypothetical protein
MTHLPKIKENFVPMGMVLPQFRASFSLYHLA